MTVLGKENRENRKKVEHMKVFSDGLHLKASETASKSMGILGIRLIKLLEILKSLLPWLMGLREISPKRCS